MDIYIHIHTYKNIHIHTYTYICNCMHVAGVVNNVAEDAVGMLILDTFNATIPRSQLEPLYLYDSASAK